MAVVRGTASTPTGNVAFEGDVSTPSLTSVNAVGANALLVVLSWNAGTSQTPNTPLFNGSSVGMTLVAQQLTNQRAIAVYRLLSPTQTTANVSASWSAFFAGANASWVQAIPYSGVDTGTPTGTVSNTSNAASASITSGNVVTSTVDGVFLSLFVTREVAAVTGIAATGSGHALIGAVNSGFGMQSAIGERAGSIVNVTMGYSWTGSEENALIVVPINASTASSGVSWMPAYQQSGRPKIVIIESGMKPSGA